jgi:hypothetical protein
MPNMMTMMGGYMGLNMVPMSMPAASPLPSNNSAAAIVHKINQELIAKGLMLPSKVHDEVISREIVINDADPGVRYKLTKRQTQEEIQSKTGAVVITRGRFRAPNGPPDLEKPLYLHISAGVQLKDTAERIKAVDAATALVEEMMKQGPPSAGALQSGGGGPAFSAVVNVGIEGDPSFNLIGRIRGPNVSPGALRSIVTRSLRTHTSYLGTSFLMSKDLRVLCHPYFVWLLLFPLISILVRFMFLVAMPSLLVYRWTSRASRYTVITYDSKLLEEFINICDR